MSKTTNRIITALFSVFIGGFFLLNLLLPDKDFSEKENRQLQTLPKFSFSSLFSGSFATRFESYCSDQFAGRDAWIETKAGAELAQGKQQNNGVFLCDGGRRRKTRSRAPCRQRIYSRTPVFQSRSP